MTAPDAPFVWLDFGWWKQPSGIVKLLSWNAANGELAFWPLGREETIILAVIPTEEEVRRRLEGWAEHCGTRDGLGWLAQRLEGCR